MKLNLGAGQDIREGYVNVDQVPLPGIDVVLNLEEPWPWSDGEAEQIIAFDIFEHVDDPIHFMGEAHRVLAVGGELYIHTSYWRTMNSFTDPTHKRFCTEETFDFWIPGTHHNQRYGAAYARGRHFRKLHIGRDGQELEVRLEKIG